MFGHHHHGHRRGRGGDQHECIGRDGHGGRWGRHGWGAGDWGLGGDWSEGRGGFGGGRSGRGGRPLDQGDLRYILLALIADKPSHGYELIKAIEDRMEGAYSPSPGVVYPTLTLLEETGLIASEAQGSKKLYSLTAEGQPYIAENKAAIDAAQERLEAARRRFGPPPAAEIRRAIQNLVMALGGRVRRGDVNTEVLQKVVDILDAAARDIERS